MHQYELSIGIHMFPPAWTPSHLPHQPIPLGYHRGLVLSLLHNTSNLHWLSILHMVTYMFQCYALKSFHAFLLEKTLESPLDSKEIKPVHPKPWIFLGRTDAEAEALILWLPNAKSRLIRKDPYAGKDWGQEEKGMIEDEMVEWDRWLNGNNFE